MRTRTHISIWKAVLTALLVLQAGLGFAGVSREIQERYRQKYVNKALFLKIPIFSEREYVLITGRTFRAEKDLGVGTPLFKVADQVRVIGLDFGRDEIRFKVGAIGGPAAAEVVFRFNGELQENFPNSEVFENAVQGTFTEGLKYTDLEDAKRKHAREQFDIMVAEIAANSGASKESVLESIASQVPAYQDALQEIEAVRNKNQDLAGQLEKLQSDHRNLQAELRTQQNEVVRLRGLSTSLQEKMDTTASQLTRIREDLRNVQGEKAGYQKELASLQRSLRLKTDTGRDPASQIVEIAQAAQKLQKDREGLEAQNSSLKAEVDRQAGVNRKLEGEIEDQEANVRKMRETIAALTSKEDSLARQYINMKQAKETLDNLKLAAASMRTQAVGEKTEGGARSGQIEIYLANVHIGTLDYSLPEAIAPQASRSAEVRFVSESIDYVKVVPEERQILQSLGERLKVQLSLSARPGTLEVKPGQTSPAQVIGERDSASWKWEITNQGTEDGWLLVNASVVNRNSDEIALWKQEQRVLSASLVRQARGYLQPIPLAVGCLIGFLLLGIAGIFRRSGRRAGESPHRTSSYSGKKGL